MKRRNFMRLAISATVGFLFPLTGGPFGRAAVDEQIVVFKGWVLKKSDFEA